MKFDLFHIRSFQFNLFWEESKKVSQLQLIYLKFEFLIIIAHVTVHVWYSHALWHEPSKHRGATFTLSEAWVWSYIKVQSNIRSLRKVCKFSISVLKNPFNFLVTHGLFSELYVTFLEPNESAKICTFFWFPDIFQLGYTALWLEHHFFISELDQWFLTTK